MKKLLFIILLAFNMQAVNYNSLLFSGNCVTCHHSNKSESAPSIQMIQKRYKSAFSDKKEFVNYMSTWVQHPNKNTSLMSEAIIKYELMPELCFDLDTLREISAYIYDTDFNNTYQK